MKKRNLYVALLALTAVLCLIFAACANYTPTNEVGVYYYDSDDGEYTLTLDDSAKFELKMTGQTLSGKFKLDGEQLSLKVGNKGVSDISATYRNDEITFTYNSASMKFIRKINYTVTFASNGGSAVDSQTVVNGRTATKPDDPTRGQIYRFLGWYVDEALNTPYDFTNAVTKDITLYAKWQEVSDGREEYTVTFDGNYDGATTTEVVTVNSKILSMPTPPTRAGYTFVDWFVSDYNDGARLTYKLDRASLITKDMVVYAAWSSSTNVDLGVSVYEKQITWNRSSTAAMYSVVVKTVEGNVVKSNPFVTSTTYNDVDFSTLAAGNYVIEVGASGMSTTVRYYRNKCLDTLTVDDFRVEGTLLYYKAVANAQKYLITITCGNDEHDHTLLDNGNSTYYNFGKCSMCSDGISFVVTAVADGYLTSTSETFTYVNDLDELTGLTYDPTTATISWNGVAKTENYIVTLTRGTAVYDIYVGNNTSFSIKSYDQGTYTVKVVATAWGYNSSAKSIQFGKSTIATPTDVRICGNVVSWNEVYGATSYKLKVGDSEFVVDGLSYDLTDIVANWTDGSAYELTVTALGDEDSVPSDALDIKYLVMNTTLAYVNGVVSWSPVVGAVKYVVKVNDTVVEQITDGRRSVAVALTKSGDNVIAVQFVDGSGNASAWASLTVKAYAVKFDVRGGNELESDTIYVAYGDEINYPQPVKSGYDLAGWYTDIGGPQSNSRLYTDKYFAGNDDLTLYAYWKGAGITVTYDYCYSADYDDSGITEWQTKVYFNSNYKFVVPVAENEFAVFAGWYTEPNGKGTRLTDENGASREVWSIAEPTTVYAYWAQILTYTLLNDGTYNVKQGPGINYVTSVTVPVTYNDISVTVVEGFAFQNALRLQTVSIPDTIKTVEATAFASCPAIANVYVYSAGAIETFYYDNGGVLFAIGDSSGDVLRYFPRARTGFYSVPAGTAQIPSQAFDGAQLSEIILPDSVHVIGTRAFANCTRLVRLTLGNNATLELNNYAFENCVALTSITIPDGVTFNLNVFDGCSSLASITCNNGDYVSTSNGLLKNSGGVLVYAPKGVSGTITIPAGVTAISENAFADCSRMTGIVIPYFVTSIGRNAFSNCTLLANVTLGAENHPTTANLSLADYAFANNRSLRTVTFINLNVTWGSHAFAECGVLETVTFVGGTTTTVGEYAFYNDFELANVTLPTTVTTIGKYAFANCTSLTTINFPASIETIGEYAFSQCEALSTVTFDGYVYSLSVLDYAFENTAALQQINLPVGTVYIGKRAFTESGLTTITLPNTITEIDNYAFENCVSLTYVRLPDDLAKLGARVFNGCSSLTKVNIGKSKYQFGTDDFAGSAVTEFEVDDDNGEYSSDNGVLYNADKTEVLGFFGTNSTVTIAATATRIAMNAFANTGVRNVYFAEGSEITVIGFGAFQDAKQLVTIVLPNSVIAIDSFAFSGCEFLTDINLGNVTSIGVQAFKDCTSLESVDLSSLTSMSKYAFWMTSDEKTSALTSVTLSSKLTSLPSYAFSGCTSLSKIDLQHVVNFGERCLEETAITSVAFSNALNSIADYAFAKTKITRLDLSGTAITNMGAYVFDHCDKLVDVTLNTAMNAITTGTFAFCTALTSIDLKNVTTVDSSAFSGCTQLTTINLSGVTKIGSSAFNNCSSISGDLVLAATNVGNSAFQGCSSIKSVTFVGEFDELTIGMRAFANCTLLVNFAFPTLTEDFEVDEEVFLNCTSLASIVLPATTNTIYERAFYGCVALKTVDFSLCLSNLESIGESAFEECVALATADLDTSANGATKLEIIYQYAFRNCTSLTSVTLPKSLKSIDTGAFEGCTSLETFSVNSGNKTLFAQDGVLFNSNGELVAYPAGKSDIDYSIPAAVKNTMITTVSGGAFVGNGHLQEITIPSTVTAIYAYAFQNCTSLTTVIFDNDCNAVCQNDAFIGCKALIQIVFGNNANPNVGNMFQGSTIESITIPASWTSLPSSIFAGMTNLKTVIFEENSQLTALPYGTFNGCSALERIDLTNCTLITVIDRQVFQGCSSLEEILLPSTLVTIESLAFNGCASLKTISIPATVKEISSDAFDGCISLTDVLVSPLNPYYEYDDGVLYTKGKLEIVKYLTSNTATAYTVPDSVTLIQAHAFMNVQGLKQVTLSDSVQTIRNNAFEFTGIETINIPSSVIYIGMNAFHGCTSLKNLTFELGGSAIMTIVQHAFDSCTSLETLVLPARLRTDSSKITGSDNAAAIGNYAFAECTSLKTVEFEANDDIATADNMKYCTLGDHAFENCTSLEKVVLPTYVASYYDTTYPGNNFLAGKGHAIGNAAFMGCTSLKEFVILTTYDFSIDSSAFRDCTSLMTLYLPASTFKINDYAFHHWSAEQTVYMVGIKETASNSWNKDWRGYCADSDLRDPSIGLHCTVTVVWEATI